MVMFRTDIIQLWSAVSVFYLKCEVDSCTAKRQFDHLLFRWLFLDFYLDRGQRSENRIFWRATPLSSTNWVEYWIISETQLILFTFPCKMAADFSHVIFILSRSVIDHLHARTKELIIINTLIAVTSWLDAVVASMNVLVWFTVITAVFKVLATPSFEQKSCDQYCSKYKM